MARGTTSLQRRISARALLSAAVLLVVALSASPSLAQFGFLTPQPKSPRASALLQKGRDAFVQGDYEGAAALYKQAQDQAQQLTAQEKTDLDSLVQKNETALKERQTGRDQLKQAKDALDKGLDSKAARFLQLAATNQFLAAADRQEMEQLDLRLRNGGVMPPGAKPADPAAGKDFRTLLKDARTALKKNDFDTADYLAHAAEKMNVGGPPSWMQPWNDTPAKVLREVKTARDAAEAAKTPPKTTPAGPLTAVKSMLGFKNDPSKDDKNATNTPPTTVALANPGQQMPTGPSQLPPVSPAQPISAKPSQLPPVSPPLPTVVKTGFETPATPQTPSTTEKEKAEKARQLIKDGYKALNEQNDAKRARDLAEKARTLNADLQFWEDTPEKLLTEIDRRAAAGHKGPAATPTAKVDPYELLRHGHDLVKKGDLDEAERLCSQAEAMPNVHWGLFDSPKNLRSEIQGERTKQDRQKAVTLLSQGRDLFKQKKYQEAEDLSYKSEKLFSAYTIWDLGDRPDKLRRDIAAARLTEKKVEVPLPPDLKGPVQPPLPPSMSASDVAKLTPPPPPPGGKASDPPFITPPLVPNAPKLTVEQSLARQKALDLTRQAVELQKQGKLLEAHAQALEAQKAAIVARKMNVAFDPSDLAPEELLLQLAGQSKQRIGALLMEAEKVGGKQGPENFSKAAGCIEQAKELAFAFGLPQQEIDMKMLWLGQMQMGGGAPPFPPFGPPPSDIAKNGPPVPLAPPVPVNDDQKQGLKFLDDARHALKAGQTMLAQKITEEAMNPKYQVQKQAEALLREIALENIEQSRLTAVRNLLAMEDAMIVGKMAYAQNIAALIDANLLPPEKLKRFSELMAALPPMPTDSGPTASAKISPTQIGPGGNAKISISDKVPPEPSGFADNVKAMETIMFEKYKSESLAVQIKAQDIFKAGKPDFKNGEPDRALEMLRDYNEQLSHAQISPNRLKLIQQPLEQRIQKYKQLRDEIEWTKAMHDAKAPPLAALQKTMQKEQARDKQISELLKEAGVLFKEHKYDQALLLGQQAHELDPDNVAANALIQMAQIAVARAVFNDGKGKQEDMILKVLTPNFDNLVDAGKPMSLNKSLLDHNKNRPNASIIKSSHLSPIEKQIESKLNNSITVKFKDTPLKQAIQDLKYLTNGINIVIDKSALDDKSISADATITLDVENIPTNSALNLMLKQVNLTYIIKDNVLQITTEENTKGKLVSFTYSVADLVIAPMSPNAKAMTDLNDMLMRTAFGPQGFGGPTPITTPNMLGGASPVSSYGQGGSGFAQNGSASGQIQPGGNNGWSKTLPKQTLEDQLIKIITSSVAPESWTEVGGKGTIQFFPFGNGLVVNQTQDIQEQVADLLQALRRLQDLEVAIEIRLVAVSESFFEYMGMDFNVNIKLNNTAVQPQIIGQQFQPFGFVNRFTPGNFVSGLTPAGTFTPDLNVPLKNSSFGLALPPAGLGGFPGSLGADGGLSLGLAFLSDIQVFMFLEAAQGDKRANAMQAPRVTVFNGQQATLQVNDTLPVLLSLQPQFGAQGEFLFFTPVQVPLNLGTNVIVTPVVTADRRFVRLSIVQQMQNLISTNVPLIPIQIPFFDAVFGQQAASNQAKVFQVFLQQPSTASITVNTTVVVPDGGTVLLGGLKTLTEQRNEYGPPILSKIPYLSRLFKNVGYGREATSLLMMVTPRIIINEEEELIYLEQLPPIPRP